MPASNVAQIGIALQTAKGTPATAPTYMFDVTGADLAPTPETETRSETGLGRDPGDTYIRVLQAGGSASVLLRPTLAPLFFYGVLGAKAVTGASAPYTHTLTPANDQPWLTVWRTLGGSIYERFDDCKITSMGIEWAAGGDVTASLGIMGLAFTRLTAAPTGGTYVNETPYRVPGVVNTIEGAVDNSLTGGSVTIEANQTPIQTTAITNSYLEPASRSITASWEQVYTDITRYAKVFYGSGAGTAPAQTVYEGALKFDFGNLTTGPSLTLDMPRFLFTGATANPDPGGDPLRLPVAGQVARPASGSILTATIKNSVAIY